VRQGFGDFINGMARNGGPSRGETERVGHIILASLSGDAYRLACTDRIFLPYRLLTDEEKLRDYRLAWLAAFLSLVRPGQIVLTCSLELTARRFHESLRLLSACQMDRGEKSLRSSFFGPCDWKKLGRRAEPQRNQSQIRRARHFWRRRAEGANNGQKL